MNSEKAWYWVAAGVLALGLSNSLAERQIGLVQGLPDQFQQATDEVTARVSDQAVRFLDVANRLSDRKDLGVDRRRGGPGAGAEPRRLPADRRGASGKPPGTGAERTSQGNLP